MEDYKPIFDDSGIAQPVSFTPLTLQSICCNTILMQDLDLAQCQQSKIVCYENIHSDAYVPLHNNDADLNQNLCYTELRNCDVYSENINQNMNTKEWMDLKEFDSYIHQLKVENDHPFPNFEEIIPQFVVRNDGYLKPQVNNPHTEDLEYKNFGINCETYCGQIENEKTQQDVKGNGRETDNNLIIVSPSEDSDFEFSLPDDIDSISLSSIEAYGQSIHNKRSKVTVEISPQIQYFTDFKKATIKGNKKEVYSNISGNKAPSENCNVISLSSDDDDSCSGYNSSDFEFITEEEAKHDGLILNYKKSDIPPKTDTFRTMEVTTSKLNTDRHSQSPKATSSNNNFEDYRQNHQIPEGENYFDLFRGIYAPSTPWFYENKSMGLVVNEYSGLGFDIGVLSRQIREYQPENDEYKEEAAECAKKILNMYPSENTKRRRRFC